MKKEQLTPVFTQEFLDKPTMIFDTLLDVPKEKIGGFYSKETYDDHMILHHEIDYELNKDQVTKIIKNQDEFNKLHEEWCGGEALENGLLDISVISEAYQTLRGTHIHYDPDYTVYYDPSFHDKSDWRL